MTLKVAAKIGEADKTYYETQVRALMEEPHVEFVGEIGGYDKEAFLGEAYALLFPIDWPEPFGLVMIESFACGTPVIAYRCGSVPEVMREGVSGFVVDSAEEAARAVAKVKRLSRRRCRAYFEERFLDTRMVDDYLNVYQAARTSWQPSSSAPAPGGDSDVQTTRDPDMQQSTGL